MALPAWQTAARARTRGFPDSRLCHIGRQQAGLRGTPARKWIFSNYHEIVTPEEAERYFTFFPAQAENVVSTAAPS